MALQISESYVNTSKGYHYGDPGWYEPFTDDRGRLFRALQREYGRCTSKVYVDDPITGQARAVGWCFLKRVEYEDAARIPQGRERTYLREVWITLREVPDTNTNDE